MLLVKTYLDKSPIHGIGVFAGETIRKDAKIWRFVYGFDRFYTRKRLAKLRTGTTATFIIFQTPEEGIGFPMSLAGFGEGYDKLP